MGPVERHIEEKLQERRDSGKLRKLSTKRAPIDFFSNDYLGLATGSILNIAGHASGSTGSRLLSGNTKQVEELEAYIANFHKAEAALIFNSGYDANTGLLSSIADRHTFFLYDELCHASIIDGIRLSQASAKYKFQHNSVPDLEKKLQRHCTEGKKCIVVLESVYSMDGDIAPLKEISVLCREFNASLVVDEAHATGIFGKNGAGLVNEERLEQEVFARMHTFGKALGCNGAVVLGSESLKQFLVNFARPFIYTTALPPQNIAAIRQAYEYLHAPDFSNAGLHDLISYFRHKIEKSEGNWIDSRSPIQALLLNSGHKAKETAEALQQAGIQVNAILHPTVPEGQERLRVCLHSLNTETEIDLLFTTLNALI